MELHIVHGTSAGFAREDDEISNVVGVYSNPQTAEVVSKVSSSKVTTIELDVIPEGLKERIKMFGYKLPE